MAPAVPLQIFSPLSSTIGFSQSNPAEKRVLAADGGLRLSRMS